MIKETKTKFFALKHGVEKELFSITEKKSGDLLISKKHQKNYEGLGMEEIQTQRFSAHVSPNSPGRTFKHTLLMKNKKSITTAQFRTKGVDGILAIIYGSSIPNLSPEKYNLRSEKSKKTIQVIQQDIGDTSFAYFIIASDKNADFNSVATSLKIAKFEFSMFDIAVMHTSLGVPAPDSADTIHLATASPRINGFPQAEIEVETKSHSVSEIFHLIEGHIEPLTQKTLERIDEQRRRVAHEIARAIRLK